MKQLKTIIYALVFISGSVLGISCSQTTKSESDNHEHSSMEEADGHHEGEAVEGQEHGDKSGEEHNGHSKLEMTEGGTKMWSPKGNGEELIKSDFHFITGAIENIIPEVVQNLEDSVLQLTVNGPPSAFVFHQTYGNIGIGTEINTDDFTGNFKLIHHAQNTSNYEFVALNGTSMKLGRVVEGAEKIFDQKDFSANGEWVNLRVSAAGTHFKGYIGNQNITHGHGDKMQDGFVGIMLEGTGTVLIKSIEVVTLEDE